MGRRKHLITLRNISLILSFFCLFVLSALLLRFIATGIEKKATVEEPVEVLHRVLFISSYDPLYFTYDAQIKGLEQALYPNGVEYDVAYMYADARGDASVDLFYNFMSKRLANQKRYEAILLGDDMALQFALKYQNELFPKTPLIFFGVNDYQLALEASKNPYMTGFYESDFIDETVELAMELFPRRKTLIGLHDDTFAGKLDFEKFWALREKYPDYAFVDLNASLLSQSDLVFLLNELPNDSILFYMTCYSDKQSNVYSMIARTGTVVRSAKVPIFRNYVGGEGFGILGGVHMDVTGQCLKAGQLLVELLGNTDISSYGLINFEGAQSSFDYTLMAEHKLDFSLLPKNTVFYNKPDTLLSHYGKIIPTVVMLAVTLIMFLIYTRIGKAISLTLIEDLRKSRNSLVTQEEQLRYQAEYDEVLDIYNRRTITEWIRNKKNADDVFSVIIIDIDDFKMLNENYGHTMADSILQYLVALLKGFVEENGWKIARFGGDELLLVINDQILEMDSPIVRDIFAAIRAPIPLGDETLAITASMGASCSDGVTPPEQHIINAETAVYEAKIRGKNGIVIYDDKMKEKALEEIRIKEKLQQAFDNDGFFMLYQPQINTQTKEVSGYEALVRMKEPGIYPGQFIPVAERSGWIWRIGRITTELVIKQLAAWRDEGKKLHPVSVNFSSNQLNDHGYVDFVEDLLKKYDIPANYLEIEITEGLFLEKSVLADDIFRRFKNLGIRLLMDDFGTGYSSLGYLTYIPVDVIKLDKSLVDTYLVEGKDSFIRNIIHLMHDLDKEMIIEGVEEENQYNRLKEFGADTIQGYYFSKPIPADEAIDFTVK
ncbi:MAG: bifunctional diguanylate cyclase/phosphodiesterase [Treponema sp.]|nr:bifunctional diguanylate cyclase/phosphodiesterase [Treponema sp.]